MTKIKQTDRQKKNIIKGYVSPNARIEEQRQASKESITGKGQHNMTLLLSQRKAAPMKSLNSSVWHFKKPPELVLS